MTHCGAIFGVLNSDWHAGSRGGKQASSAIPSTTSSSGSKSFHLFTIPLLSPIIEPVSVIFRYES